MQSYLHGIESMPENNAQSKTPADICGILAVSPNIITTDEVMPLTRRSTHYFVRSKLSSFSPLTVDPLARGH
jgi:hypothetical protein